MSDSSCSNCDINCKYRDMVYDCYIYRCLDIYKYIDDNKLHQIKDTIKMLDDCKYSSYSDDFNLSIYELNSIIEKYDDAVNIIKNTKIQIMFLRILIECKDEIIEYLMKPSGIFLSNICHDDTTIYRIYNDIFYFIENYMKNYIKNKYAVEQDSLLTIFSNQNVQKNLLLNIIISLILTINNDKYDNFREPIKESDENMMKELILCFYNILIENNIGFNGIPLNIIENNIEIFM